eukprot:TRINITY_DN3010_c0_g1_i1.p1 TRINITY_DN3010_c0_g1~~TRINITY_DN3010_c0_g1_i1.p1  ORF type:complete len:366 (-),score=24.29 TRINITY_DN3010_c0_g1_i1:101-1198(-)
MMLFRAASGNAAERHRRWRRFSYVAYDHWRLIALQAWKATMMWTNQGAALRAMYATRHFCQSLLQRGLHALQDFAYWRKHNRNALKTGSEHAAKLKLRFWHLKIINKGLWKDTGKLWAASIYFRRTLHGGPSTGSLYQEAALQLLEAWAVLLKKAAVRGVKRWAVRVRKRDAQQLLLWRAKNWDTVRMFAHAMRILRAATAKPSSGTSMTASRQQGTSSHSVTTDRMPVSAERTAVRSLLYAEAFRHGHLLRRCLKHWHQHGTSKTCGQVTQQAHSGQASIMGTCMASQPATLEAPVGGGPPLLLTTSNQRRQHARRTTVGAKTPCPPAKEAVMPNQRLLKFGMSDSNPTHGGYSGLQLRRSKFK